MNFSCWVSPSGRPAAVLLGAAACAALVACSGSLPPPTDRLASSEAAVRGARELGAARDPQAALHLQLAEEQVTTARKLMRDGANEEADRMLQRARSDAELSVALAKEATARVAAERAEELIHKAKQAPAAP